MGEEAEDEDVIKMLSNHCLSSSPPSLLSHYFAASLSFFLWFHVFSLWVSSFHFLFSGNSMELMIDWPRFTVLSSVVMRPWANCLAILYFSHMQNRYDNDYLKV